MYLKATESVPSMAPHEFGVVDSGSSWVGGVVESGKAPWVFLSLLFKTILAFLHPFGQIVCLDSESPRSLSEVVVRLRSVIFVLANVVLDWLRVCT